MNVLADAAAAAPFEMRVVRIEEAGWRPGPSSDPESDDGGSDFVADDVSDDDDE